MSIMGRPCRLIPADFTEVYERLGWEARDHYGVRTDTFTRWVNEQGREPLRNRRRNYVLGNRLSYLKPRPA